MEELLYTVEPLLGKGVSSEQGLQVRLAIAHSVLLTAPIVGQHLTVNVLVNYVVGQEELSWPLSQFTSLVIF